MLINRVFKIILKCIFIFFSLGTKGFYKFITMPIKKCLHNVEKMLILRKEVHSSMRVYF